MENLYKETTEVLKENGKDWEDVLSIFNSDGEIPIGRFKDIADQLYDGGYGGIEVRTDLIILGDMWWLERSEYDGAEWWDFKTYPTKPDNIDYSNGIFCDTRMNKRY